MSFTAEDIFGICEQNKFPLSSGAKEKLLLYERLLRETNSRVNLISRRDVNNIWTNHILHSLSPVLMFTLPPDIRILDLGTGGGLPGIPIAIARPDLVLCLADSIQKKSTALAEIVRALELPNVNVVNGRVEDLGRGVPHKHRFGGVIARAVAPLSQLVKWSRPLLVNGRMTNTARHDYRSPVVPFLLALKGGDLSSEVAEVSAGNGLRRIDIIDVDLRGAEAAGLEGKKIAIVEFT